MNDKHCVCYVSAKPQKSLNRPPCSATKDECWCTQEIAACSQHHTEVSVVSDWSPNLGFWSLMAPILHLAQLPPLPHEPYSPNHTYIALIASDGDSVQVRSCQYPKLACISSLASVCHSLRQPLSVLKLAAGNVLVSARQYNCI